MIGGEIAIRVYHWFKYDKNQPGETIALDNQLGWLPTSRYLFHGDKLDASGKSYSAKIQTNRDGFRIFGNPREENKKKVLFLGDSFTHALTENGVIYKVPKSAPLFRNIANRYSRFLYFILNRIDRLNAVHADSVEDIIQERGMSYPLFRESVEMTEQLIKKMKLRIPSKTLLYAFCADDTDPYYEELKRLSKKNGIYFIDGIPQAIRSAEQRGITTRAEDKAHWNETGHRIAADVLKQYFEANW